MDVHIVDVNTFKENVNQKKVSTYDQVELNLNKIETYDKLDVNLKEIGGRWISNGDPVPVKIQYLTEQKKKLETKKYVVNPDLKVGRI